MSALICLCRSKAPAFKANKLLSFVLGASLALAITAYPQQTWAVSPDVGIKPEDSDKPSAAMGRMPTQTAPQPPTPPAFQLTLPVAPDISNKGIFHPETFTLPNGLAVIVIANHRAPIISHMIWYQVGAADEPVGKTGLAHLLEHLMFKGTPTVPDGAFSHAIAANGGQDNAFTSWDYTAYFQNIAKDRLEMVMKMEADRMTNLTLTEEQVAREKKVVLAERQQTTENNPAQKLMEAMRSAEFVNHPYMRPITGWPNEVEALSREDALAFYKTWYSPSNAIVVVSGDVDLDDVKALAEKTYGALPAKAVPLRKRLKEPEQIAEKRITLRDEDVNQPVFMRTYRAPSWKYGDHADILPLEVMAEILGGGSTSRLYQRLVVDLHLATDVSLSYDPMAIDQSEVNVSIVPAPNRDLTLIEEAYNAVVQDLLKNGLTAAELNRAQSRLIDSATFARDSVEAPAYLFGQTLSTGGDISDIEEWPQRILAVTQEQVQQVAQKTFEQPDTVTGILLPAAAPNQLKTEADKQKSAQPSTNASLSASSLTHMKNSGER